MAARALCDCCLMCRCAVAHMLFRYSVCGRPWCTWVQTGLCVPACITAFPSRQRVVLSMPTSMRCRCWRTAVRSGGVAWVCACCERPRSLTYTCNQIGPLRASSCACFKHKTPRWLAILTEAASVPSTFALLQLVKCSANQSRGRSQLCVHWLQAWRIGAGAHASPMTRLPLSHSRRRASRCAPPALLLSCTCHSWRAVWE